MDGPNFPSVMKPLSLSVFAEEEEEGSGVHLIKSCGVRERDGDFEATTTTTIAAAVRVLCGANFYRNGGLR